MSNIDRDLDVSKKNMVRDGRAQQGNEEATGPAIPAKTRETSAVASAARSWTDICALMVEAISGQLSISRHFCRHCGESLTLTRSRASVSSTINIVRDCATLIRISCAKLHKIQSRCATQSISIVPVIEAILRQVLSAVFFGAQLERMKSLI